MKNFRERLSDRFTYLNRAQAFHDFAAKFFHGTRHKLLTIKRKRGQEKEC